MDMDTNLESDTAQLLGSNVARRGGRRGKGRNADSASNGQSMMVLSEPEVLPNNDGYTQQAQQLKRLKALSGSLGDSLPSVRAQLAANTYAESKEFHKRSIKETTPLLGNVAHADEEKVGGTNDNSSFDAIGLKGSYDSVSITPHSHKEQEKGWRAAAKKGYTIAKVIILTVLLVASIILFSIHDEHEEYYYFLSVGAGQSRVIHHNVSDIEDWKFVTVEVQGPFLDLPYDNESFQEDQKACSDYLFLCNSGYEPDRCPFEGENPNCHSLQIDPDYHDPRAHDRFDTVSKHLVIGDKSNFSLMFMSEVAPSVEFQAIVIGEKLANTYQVVIAAIILFWVYVLIGFDIVHRTIAAMIGSTVTLGVLSMLGKRPSLDEVVEWIDLDTICLLFGMMVLVGIFSQTGFFDYSAVKAYKLARGRPGLLIALLCLFSAVVSAFLDNVTTILLLTPVSIRLCQVLNLDPRPVLIAEVVFSNIGGTATAVGDPPNVIIVSNSLIKNAGIDFTEFTLHLALGILMCLVSAYILLFAIYYFQFVRVKNKDPPHISELKREVAIWKRTAQRLNIVSLEERAVRDALLSKARDVESQLDLEQNTTMQSSEDIWKKNLAELESKYCITDYVLLIKSSIVLLVVILLFFLSNIIPKIELDLGWIAIFGAVVLLILSNVQDLEAILHKVEWGTLLFFGGLFVLMEGLAELGLIRQLGDWMVVIVEQVAYEHQMLVAIIIVLWISALASAFIDNIPFTTATIPVIVELANSDKLCLSLKPLVWALAFGACLGGNGTLIGASANVVAAGIAEQNGYKISFMKFFVIGFPMMLITTLTASVYLIICHQAIQWNTEDARECVARKTSSLALSLV